MNTSQFWTDTEDATLLDLAERGATAAEMTTVLRGRSTQAIRTRRRDLGRGPGHKTAQTSKAPLLQRIAALDATIAAAMAERRVDWDLVDVLLQGLEYLRWKAGQV